MQAQSVNHERGYYYNLVEYSFNEDKFLDDLIYNPEKDEYKIQGKSSAYMQSIEMDSFSKLSKNPSVQQALYYLSGLEYILTAQDEPKVYFGLENGLYYASPYAYLDESLMEIDFDVILDTCYDIDPPLTDPPPMYGYDARCRPWY